MYEIVMESIQFSNGKRYRFPTEIAEAIDFEDSIIVRLQPGQPAALQNIFALDYRGNLLWKIPMPRTFSLANPFVGLFRKGGNVEALNWDGHVVTLHPKSGIVIAEDHYQMGTSNRRAASIRRWI